MPVDANHAGEHGGWFTTTHWSVVLKAGAATPDAHAAMECLCQTYWYPLYAYARQRGWTADDGKDLTQEFFTRLLQKNQLAHASREKGRFRSFLLASFKNFMVNESDRANAQKRGSGQPTISLDAAAAEGMFSLEPVSDLTPEKVFEQRWAATLLERAFGRLQNEYTHPKKQALFDSLKPFLTAEATAGDYDLVAQRLQMEPKTVAVAVHRLRKHYRECVRAEVANTVANPADLEDEMRYLFSVLTG
jgi:RNA polymerase sigma-70 factor (ECF subfamily)